MSLDLASAQTGLCADTGEHCACTQPRSKATASLLLQRRSKYFLAFQSHFQGNLTETCKYYDADAFFCPDCKHLGPEFAERFAPALVAAARPSHALSPVTAPPQQPGKGEGVTKPILALSGKKQPFSSFTQIQLPPRRRLTSHPITDQSENRSRSGTAQPRLRLASDGGKN